MAPMMAPRRYASAEKSSTFLSVIKISAEWPPRKTTAS
jgi:hypothetical protein